MSEKKNIWNQDLEIGKITEDKLDAAYDIVRAKCREQQSSCKIQPIKKHTRRAWAAVFAAALLSVSGLSVLAAAGYFSKQLEKNDNGVTYTFDVNYELTPVEVKAEPTYLPDGIEAKGDGHFGDPDKDNFTITPLTMVNLDETEKKMSFTDVDNVNKTIIQNMEAHILTSNDEQKYHRGKQIFLFNPVDGYVIWIYGNYSIPLSELEKVAEHLKITTNDTSSLKYDAGYETEEEAGKAWNLEMKQLLEKGVSADDITPVGEERYCEVSGCGYTVEEVTIADSLYDLSGYSNSGVADPEALKSWLNEDGTHKTYLRAHYSSDGKLLAEEEPHVKFMQIKVTAHQHDSYVDAVTDTALNAQLVRLIPRKDGKTYSWASDFYMAVPSEEYELQLDNSAFCLDQAEKPAKDPSFFYKTLGKDESLTYNLIFAIDEDWLTDGKPENLVLNFDGTGNDPFMPMYSAL